MVERIIETVLIVALNILVIGAGIGAYRALR
jgi:hypothetical protein